MKKRYLGLICSMVLLFSMVLSTTTYAVTQLRVGDYVKFGQYNNEPIVWRVIALDEENDPLLWSDSIIAFKAFDAAGDFHVNKDQKKSGRNYWPDSTLRQWLNSELNEVIWYQNIPSKENVSKADFAYDKEAGFLAEQNFGIKEIQMIEKFSHPVVLSSLDSDKKEVGDSQFKASDSIEKSAKDYDKAYAQNVVDRVFLLSEKQLQEYVISRGWDIHADPTSTTIFKSPYKEKGSKDYWYWLITPANNNTSINCIPQKEEKVLNKEAFDAEGGVRPAMFIKGDMIHSINGRGVKEAPYTIQ